MAYISDAVPRRRTRRPGCTESLKYHTTKLSKKSKLYEASYFTTIKVPMGVQRNTSKNHNGTTIRREDYSDQVYIRDGSYLEGKQGEGGV